MQPASFTQSRVIKISTSASSSHASRSQQDLASSSSIAVADHTEAGHEIQYDHGQHDPSEEMKAADNNTIQVRYATQPPPDFEGLPEMQIIPDGLQGWPLVDKFRHIYNYEKAWLQGLVDVRMNLLMEMQILIDSGMPPFSFAQADNLEYPNQDCMGHFFAYRDHVEELAGYYERVTKLARITWRMRSNFNRQFEAERENGGLKPHEKRILYPHLMAIRQYDHDVHKIRMWTNPSSIFQPNEIIHRNDNNGMHPIRVVQMAREDALEIEERLY